jgi:hypothetical protein
MLLFSLDPFVQNGVVKLNQAFAETVYYAAPLQAFG